MNDSDNQISKVEKPKRAGRPKGQPKTGGRAIGTPNKNSWNLRNALDEAGFDPAKEIVGIISQTKDLDARWERLTYLMRFLYPQLKEVESAPTSSAANPAQSPANQASTDTLLSIVKP